MQIATAYAWLRAHEVEILGAGASLVALWKAIPITHRLELERRYPRLVGALRTLVALLPDLLGALRVLWYGVGAGRPRPEIVPSAELFRDVLRPEPAPEAGAQDVPPATSSTSRPGFVAPPVLRLLASAAVLVFVPAALARCAAGVPQVTAVAPRIVERPEYGTCLEVGGKVEVRGHGVLTQLSSTCWESLMDASARRDASAVPDAEPEPAAIEGKGDGGEL